MPVSTKAHGSDPSTPSLRSKNKNKKPWSTWNYVVISFFILLYYAISISISMFNTQVLGKSRMNFPYPLYAALIYDLIQFSMAFLLMAALNVKSRTAVGPVQAYKDLGSDRFWKVIFPCAIAAGLDISLSNCSLKHVSLSFYTMVKSSSPMFILIFAFVFRLEKLNWSLALIIGVIGAGTVLTVYNPASFNLFGFILVFSAAVMSGVRWALTQLIIEQQVGKDERVKSANGPLSAILFLTPPIGATMVLLCSIFEGLPTVMRTLYADIGTAMRTSGICITGGILTFSLILTEYKVVESTSVITLSISGIVKEIMMIAVSVLYFKDQLLPINYVGLAISICGIIGYNWYKISKKAPGQLKTMVGGDMYLSVPTNDPLDMFINPFGDDDEDEEEVGDEETAYLELEGGLKEASKTSKSHHSSLNTSIDQLGSKSQVLSEAEECLNGLKTHWTSLPALDRYPAVKPTSEPNIQQ